MKAFRFFLPVILASSSFNLAFTTANSAKSLATNQFLQRNLLNLVQQPVCKMSTNLREEVDRQKKFYDSMSLDEKRKQYACGDKFITLDKIPSWQATFSKVPADLSTNVKVDQNLNEKVSILRDDITKLEIDAIVNAANSRLAGGGGVDGAIHSAASRHLLLNECSLKEGGLPTGQVLLTSAYKLPSKRIIHTVGPVGEKPDLLKNCYENSLNLAKDNNLRSIAYPCISTGVYGYPNEKAAHVALSTVRNWLESNHESIDRVIFCLFLPIDVEIYNKLMHVYFPKK